MVELRDVQMHFDEKKVLDGFSLKIEPQERLVIMGQTGSGNGDVVFGVAPTSGAPPLGRGR